MWSVNEGEQRFDSHTDRLMNYIRFWQADGESQKISICNTASGNCIPLATVWNRIMEKLPNGMKKRWQRAIPLRPIPWAAFTAGDRAWNRMMASAVGGGIYSRYVSSNLHNAFSPERPKTNPVKEAFNAKSIYQPYFHLHVYNSIKIMVGTFVSTIILSLHRYGAGLFISR